MDRVIWCDRGWQPVEYGFCPSEKAWKREMKAMGVEGEDYPTSDGRATFFTRNGKTVALVTINEEAAKARSLIEIIGLIVHEGTHIWQEILLSIGEKKPSPEFEAYSMQAITQELLFAYQKTRGLPA